MAVRDPGRHSTAAARLDSALLDFDWSLKYAVASRSIASVDKPLVRLELYVSKRSSEVEGGSTGRLLPENQMQVYVGEFTKDQLETVISAMGAIEQAMDGADCAAES